MAIYNKHHEAILKYLKHNKRECWHNLFHEDSSFIRSLVSPAPPYPIDKLREANISAQTAFKKLESDGLVYDTNGERWYSLTPKGENLLRSNFKEIPVLDIEALKEVYDFHSKIKRVSYSLLTNGHYKEAIQAALVEVIDKVKQVAGNPKNVSGKELDGDSLMQRVFGCDGDNKPLIKLNKLEDSLDKAEQRGFMYLFKGIVGIRDKKAHLNFIQNDPYKTMEYLSLASLLMRLLDKEFLKNFNK